MKKVFTNWRYYVLTVLFAVGFIGVALPSGESVREMAAWQWLGYAIASFVVGCISFYCMHRLTCYWLKAGKLPEYEKLLKMSENA